MIDVKVGDEFDDVSKEVIDLFVRFASLKKKLVRIQAELDNVRELIRQKGL